MSTTIAPYNDSMRIGSGFNSYTQQLCINDAVIKENRTAATEQDLSPKLTDGTRVSQQVTFTSKFVEHASDITEAMSISGALEIKFQGIGLKASGSYVDSSKVKENDLNFFVQVKVVNQQLIADDVTKFNVIPNVAVTDSKKFTDTYGDSYISGFLEGGEFNALLSVKVHDSKKLKEIKGALSLNLEKAGFGVSGEVEGKYTNDEIIKDSETSITVAWAGGGEIRDDETKGWTIDSMAKAAFLFPEKVRRIPQRTHAIVTKYSALRSYQLLSNRGSALDYENAGVYTNSFLESYLEYKLVGKDIQSMSDDVSNGSKSLRERPNATEIADDIEAMIQEFVDIIKDARGKEDAKALPKTVYKPTLGNLERARRHCRLQMIRIVQEVDAVSDDPKIATDPNRVGQFLSPVLFRQLLPEIAALSPEKDEDLMIWDSPTECVRTLTGHSDYVTSVAFSHNSAQVVSGSFDNTVKIWNSKTVHW
ncbi:hypothetical protein HFD88_005911 [Aspergillus terreus]|nr:hypothetical protein HFD88_005911 [Aspergillus terreus]